MKRALTLAAALALVSCGTARDDSAPGPHDFALTLPVEAAPGGGVQQLALPAAALLGIQREDRGDIRLFDGAGRPLAVALLDERASTTAEVRLLAIPVSEPQGGKAGPGVSVRVDQDGRTVTVGTAGDAAAQPEGSVLFDSRAVKEPAQAIALDADLPVQQPVTVTLETSGDLTTWQPLAEQVLFRPGAGADLLGSGRIALQGALLENRYLRASWSGAPTARVRAAVLHTASIPQPARIPVEAKGQVLTDAHHVDFALPPGLSPAALRVTMTGRDGVVPLRLLGRNAVDEPWALLAVNSLKQDGKGALLEFGGAPLRQFRIEADPRGAGFSQAPGMEFRFDPVVLLAAFNGNPPYRLAVGNAKAAPALFAAADLGARGRPYPRAAARDDAAPSQIDLAKSAAGSAATLRVMVLWSALIAGVLVLALAAYRLLRANT